MVILALGHKEKTLPAKSATATSTGLTQGKQCKVCGVITVKQEVIPKLSGTNQGSTTQNPVTSVAGIKSVSIAKSVTYTGKALKPKVMVTDTNGKKTVTVKKAKVISAKVTNLKPKKTYYVKVRAYKTVKGIKYYSNWSAVKTAKTK